MKKIRSDIPSISSKLGLLRTNQTHLDSIGKKIDIAIPCTLRINNWISLVQLKGYKIKRLLILESKLGPLSGHVPAIKEVNDYLRKVVQSYINFSSKWIGVCMSPFSCVQYRSQIRLLKMVLRKKHYYIPSLLQKEALNHRRYSLHYCVRALS